jgi:hypothetical protein
LILSGTLLADEGFIITKAGVNVMPNKVFKTEKEARRFIDLLEKSWFGRLASSASSPDSLEGDIREFVAWESLKSGR